MNKKFTLTSAAFEGSITVEYNDRGYLVGYQSEAEMSEAQMQYWADKFPASDVSLMELAKTTKLQIKEIAKDLSFTNFWQLYNYKVGAKARAEKLWNALCDADKALALNCIPAYDYFLACKKNQDKMYPETFINKRGFEVEYGKLVKR